MGVAVEPFVAVTAVVLALELIELHQHRANAVSGLVEPRRSVMSDYGYDEIAAIIGKSEGNCRRGGGGMITFETRVRIERPLEVFAYVSDPLNFP
jgi:hypothetical protein